MKTYEVKPGSRVDLKKWAVSDKEAFGAGKEVGREKLLHLNKKLEALQELLYAGHRHKVLIILQAMDTGGKDGVIRTVFEGVNPQGVRVAVFKAPTAEELDHDYLWRAHRHVPARGEMVIFNRSYYEDVLIVRVNDLVPQKIWKRRYEQINCFERMLAEEGVTLLKFFIHIDEEEQKRRLQSRLDDRQKHWKFDKTDLKERAKWSSYMKAYEAALSRTSTPWAPWHIIPGNSKWYRNLVISNIIVETLESLKMKFPPPQSGLDEIVVD